MRKYNIFIEYMDGREVVYNDVEFARNVTETAYQFILGSGRFVSIPVKNVRVYQAEEVSA